MKKETELGKKIPQLHISDRGLALKYINKKNSILKK